VLGLLVHSTGGRGFEWERILTVGGRRLLVVRGTKRWCARKPAIHVCVRRARHPGRAASCGPAVVSRCSVAHAGAQIQNGDGDVLERSHQLSALGDSLAAVRGTSRGLLVLVSGEAGVGKTALVRRFCDEQTGSARVLWGACDALFTPRPLGPLFDIADTTSGELEELVASGARPHEVVAALMRELQTHKPTIVVLEDVHWADEATLDVLRLLARRVEAVPALVLATYRDDGLDHAHPLRLVLGELPTGQAVGRVQIAPLSPTAVAELAAPHEVDPDELYRKTAGNPFFVTEVIAAGEHQEIPQTVRDAVLARTARLSPGARTLVEAVPIAPQQIELWLLEALAGKAVEHLDECLTSGMLASEPGGVAFRHELARLAVEESLGPNQRIVLHRKALEALAARPSGVPDLARLAHHAEAACDAAAVLEFAPAAGERASSLGAHREAAAQYGRALRFADDLALEAQAELLEHRSYECYLTGQFTEAIEAQALALEHRRKAGDPLKEGDALRSLSRLLRFVGRTTEAAQTGRDAVALLERHSPGPQLAIAYCNVSHTCVTAEDADGATTWGRRALELAERLDDVEARVYALTNLGVVEFLAGAPEGLEKLELCLEIAQREGLDYHSGRAFLSLVWWPLRHRRFDLVSRYLEAGLAFCSERGLDLWRLFLLACSARLELDRGDWAAATDFAALVLRDPRTWPVPHVFALSTLGLVRARRGDPDVWSPLDEARASAEPTGELQQIGPVATAIAEAAWLEGRHERVAAETQAAFELALRRRSPWLAGELACWRWRAGVDDELPPGALAEPYAAQIAGDWARAAELWTEIGCPYEVALALAEADDKDALRAALDELRRLGAQPAAATVARRLRERGVRGLPRGPRSSTRQNPAHLTAREVEVLALVAEGLRNAQIAERLFLSEKTVSHHVSAILRKLDVRTRGEAGAEAARLGLAGQDR
jgi:DNA-binding CsgD family transcriptional regulator/tetratricopeptide (TPR) repeat protein